MYIYNMDIRSATLTKNGSASLITTIPCEWWRNAGIDIDDPRSVHMTYDSETKQIVVDLSEHGGMD